MSQPGYLLRFGIVAVVSACQYQAPLIPPRDANGELLAVTNIIRGEIVVAAPISEAAQVIVFVTSANNPMPPYGTGRPTTITTVRASDFSDSTNGILSAPFSVSNVPDGEWVITALMDRDGNFNPLSSGMSGATCGDVGGAHVTNLVDRELASVTVAGGELADGITVVLATVFPLERPAFVVDEFGGSGGIVDRSDDNGSFTLNSSAIYSQLVELDGPAEFADGECGAIFPIQAPDVDNNGSPDPHPTYGPAGIPDLWPRIYLTYLGEPQISETGVSFESSLAVGESWTAEAIPDPTYLLGGAVTPGVTIYEPELDVIWLPVARHTTLENGNVFSETITEPSEIPPGAWAITVVSFTGQTWTLPNDLAGYSSTSDSFDPLTQLAWLTVL